MSSPVEVVEVLQYDLPAWRGRVMVVEELRGKENLEDCVTLCDPVARLRLASVPSKDVHVM